MKAREYKVLAMAVEHGAARAYRRAYKHLEPGEHPDEYTLINHIETEVLDSILEWFDLGPWGSAQHGGE